MARESSLFRQLVEWPSRAHSDTEPSRPTRVGVTNEITNKHHGPASRTSGGSGPLDPRHAVLLCALRLQKKRLARPPRKDSARRQVGSELS